MSAWLWGGEEGFAEYDIETQAARGWEQVGRILVASDDTRSLPLWLPPGSEWWDVARSALQGRPFRIRRRRQVQGSDLERPASRFGDKFRVRSYAPRADASPLPGGRCTFLHHDAEGPRAYLRLHWGRKRAETAVAGGPLRPDPEGVVFEPLAMPAMWPDASAYFGTW
jgi:hypothetical protein